MAPIFATTTSSEPLRQRLFKRAVLASMLRLDAAHASIEP